ncbi:type II/IV secretion system ATPase subunit [Candidatus Nitrosotenuis aquarius]|uniref:type II/IV secretion system ATPase subunit n=1 Tax=Candidatus Nitrosotenuis aquarius TaxID=1846278 RepID=UPI000C1F8247|nr:type II/IV secretion system ATPase subunit [Candidatus Nitrosotenuis aquarius]
MDLAKAQRGTPFIRIKKTSPFDFSKFTIKKEKPVARQDASLSTNVNLDSSEIQDLVPKFKTLNKIEFDDAEIYAGLIKDPTSKNGLRYVIIEPQLSKTDEINFKVIKKLLISELDISLNSIKTKKDAARELKSKILELIKKYNMEIPTRSLSKITYYAIRDFVYLGKIEPLMRDHLIEEISCDGVNVPLYIWHREFESVPTNIVYENDDELNNFVQKMSYIGGKHASLANPIVDASLPDGSRINLTLGSEITKRGSTFTIRRFRADPITIVDLIRFKTISIHEAAYLWYVVENNSTMLVAGGTASGKTTLLNSLSSFIRPGQKIVSIEDTHELNLLHENWIPAVSRQNFTDGQIGEITQFDLLRAALRQRPDILIVGETRGREAYTLFQAMATGHGGFSSIHADSIEATLTRLVSSPMDVPKALIANTLDLITLQLKLRINDKSIRRIIKISEIQGLDDKTGEIKTHDIFRWNPNDDVHEYFGNSLVLEKIKEKTGVTDDQIAYEFKKRKTALEWLSQNNIRSHKAVMENILEFYSNSDRFYEKKRMVIEN